MTRPTTRRTLGLERLEARQVLSHGGPSAEAQYMLELINQARTNPSAAAERYTSNLDGDTLATLNYYNIDVNQARQRIASAPAKPPLAWSPRLAAAAQAQSDYQNSIAQQTHSGPNGMDLNARLSQAGYTNEASNGENAYAYARSVDQAMQAFLIDWGVSDQGHFKHLLQPDISADDSFHEVGIGITDTDKPGFGPKVITQDFGSQAGEDPQLVGVAYNDRNGDNFYEPGEGREGVAIRVQDLQTGQTASTETIDAGGYQISLKPGQYQVNASVGGQTVGSQQVTIGKDNVKVDFNLNQAPPPARAMTARSATPTPPPPPPQPAPALTNTISQQTSPAPQPSAQSQPSSADSAFNAGGLSWQSWKVSWKCWNAQSGQLTS